MLGPRGGSGSSRGASKRQGLEATRHDAAAEPGSVVERRDLREALQQDLEDDPALQPRQRGAQAVVDAPVPG